MKVEDFLTGWTTISVSIKILHNGNSNESQESCLSSVSLVADYGLEFRSSVSGIGRISLFSTATDPSLPFPYSHPVDTAGETDHSGLVPWLQVRELIPLHPYAFFRGNMDSFALVRFQIVCWDVTPCSLVVTDRRCRGAYCLHPQGGATSHKRAICSVPLHNSNKEGNKKSGTNKYILYLY
jgi:hypothetical protein